jgi:hypothetical protein
MNDQIEEVTAEKYREIDQIILQHSQEFTPKCQEIANNSQIYYTNKIQIEKIKLDAVINNHRPPPIDSMYGKFEKTNLFTKLNYLAREVKEQHQEL